LGVSVQAASDPSAALGGTQPATDNGALITNVQSGSGADGIGLKGGDVITAIDGSDIKDDQALHLALTKYHPGAHVQVTWVDSSGTKHTETAQLGEGPPA
jgi:S1-C subfamily serine protease